MKKPSREDIVLLAKEAADGNRVAAEQLLRLHLPNIRALAHEVDEGHGYADDLVGAGQVAYMEALPKLVIAKLAVRSTDPVWAYQKTVLRRAMRSHRWELEAPLHVPHRTRHRAFAATKGHEYADEAERFDLIRGATSLPVAKAMGAKAIPLDSSRPTEVDGSDGDYLDTMDLLDHEADDRW